MQHIVDRRDLAFHLHETLDAEGLSVLPRFSGHDRATYEAAIDAAERLAREKFASHAAKLDAEEPRFDGERVHIIPEVGEALAAYHAGGFHLAHRDEAEGGMQLPLLISQAIAALFTGANAATMAYPFLTIAAANLLSAHGNDDQKRRYLVPMLEGRFFGTMCLSEPGAGSSLGDIRTKAVPHGDGTYRLFGSKMWISAGEHELSETIVHLVLARIEGAASGTKGLSLFAVPKHHVDEAGHVGERNDIALAGLNHKMGYRGTTNCLLNFGEKGDGAAGTLIGQPGQGLACMFHMMNEARIGVGLGATMMGYVGYLHARDYARERLQGRLPGNKDPESPQVPILAHADVRRMLLTQKCYVEGALQLCLYCARLVDVADESGDEALVRRNRLLLEILTPIAKAWPSEWCLEANKLAIQVLGGYGYTRDHPLERLYRDNRLNPIHEGTNGIQSLDLLGRKVVMENGLAFRHMLEAMGEDIGEAMADPQLSDLVAALQGAIDLLSRTTVRLVSAAREGKTDLFLANSHSYLLMTGHIVIAWMWLRQSVAAAKGLRNAEGADAGFYAGKLIAARFFFSHELPKIGPMAALLSSLDRLVLDMPDEGF